MTLERGVLFREPTPALHSNPPTLDGCPMFAPAYVGRQRRGEAPSTVCLFLPPSPGLTKERVGTRHSSRFESAANRTQPSPLSSRLPRPAVGPEESWVTKNISDPATTFIEPEPFPLSSRAYPDFLLHRSHRRPLMWFSLKRTTCSRPKPQLSTGNPGEPRDLQFRGPLVETRNTMLKQNCHLEQATRGCELEDQMTGFLYRQQRMGWATSRSFFARCGIPRHSTRNSVGCHLDRSVAQWRDLRSPFISHADSLPPAALAFFRKVS
jgi:hypothetical protein